MSTADTDRIGPFLPSFEWISDSYFIFVECGDAYSDTELMEHLGITGYSLVTPEDTSAESVYRSLCVQIANDGKWAHIMDDSFYTLWSSKYLRDRIADFSKLHNIFTCSFGDADHSFDFEYYEGSKLKRRYVFLDTNYDRDSGYVAQDYGVALLGEEKVSKEVDMFKMVEGIESALGIKSDEIKSSSIRTYTKPYPKRSFIGRLLGKPDPEDVWGWTPWQEFWE